LIEPDGFAGPLLGDSVRGRVAGSVEQSSSVAGVLRVGSRFHPGAESLPPTRNEIDWPGRL